jgi:hypothetical protein
MTPMFSAYVVVGEPPTADATAVPRPSPINARPRYGSRSWPVISETAFTWPEFSASRAITDGITSRTKVSLNAGRCGPVSVPNVGLTTVPGSPIHAAWATPLHSMRGTAMHLPAAVHDWTVENWSAIHEIT